VTTRILLIARNAFRTIMSRRALYVWAAAVLLMFFRAAPQIIAGYRSERMRVFQHSDAVAGSLEVWALLCLGAAIFLAAGAVATEMSTRTIVTVMARPVHRWELLVGKWIGVSAFAMVTLGIGVALALGLARYLGVDVDFVILRFAVDRAFTAIVVYAGIAVVLGSFGSWVIAAGLTLMLAFVPMYINELKNLEDSPGWQRVGVALDWVVPDGYEGRFASISRIPFPELPSRPAAAPRTAPAPIRLTTNDHYLALLENLVYGLVYFLAGCAAFARRNIELA
jgi:hypothetical protein